MRRPGKELLSAGLLPSFSKTFPHDGIVIKTATDHGDNDGHYHATTNHLTCFVHVIWILNTILDDVMQEKAPRGTVLSLLTNHFVIVIETMLSQQLSL